MVFNSNITETSSSLPPARDTVAEEGAGASSTLREERSLSSSGTMRNRDTRSSKTELGVRLVGDDVLAKTSEGGPVEAETESYLSQVKVFCFTFVLY